MQTIRDSLKLQHLFRFVGFIFFHKNSFFAVLFPKIYPFFDFHLRVIELSSVDCKRIFFLPAAQYPITAKIKISEYFMMFTLLSALKLIYLMKKLIKKILFLKVFFDTLL